MADTKGEDATESDVESSHRLPRQAEDDVDGNIVKPDGAGTVDGSDSLGGGMAAIHPT